MASLAFVDEDGELVLEQSTVDMYDDEAEDEEDEAKVQQFNSGFLVDFSDVESEKQLNSFVDETVDGDVSEVIVPDTCEFRNEVLVEDTADEGEGELEMLGSNEAFELFQEWQRYEIRIEELQKMAEDVKKMVKETKSHSKMLQKAMKKQLTPSPKSSPVRRKRQIHSQFSQLESPLVTSQTPKPKKQKVPPPDQRLFLRLSTILTVKFLEQFLTQFETFFSDCVLCTNLPLLGLNFP